MRILLIICFISLNWLSYANTYENVKSDIDSGLLPVEAAKNAHDNNELSENVVQALVNSNVDVVKAVQTVAKEWSSCDATYASVKKGVQLSPDRADEIVASVAILRGCHCNAQSFWARSRFENRLRPRIRRALVEISSSCSCASAGIEAAMEVVPNKAEDMIDAVIVAKNRAERTVDSIGQIGVIPKKKYWGDNQVKTKDTNLVRNIGICEGDSNELDEFAPEDTWQNANGALTSILANKALGQHKLLCKEEEQDKTLDEQNENKGKKLIISQYIEGQGNNQALELYNGSNEAIDLLTENYQLELFFHGYDFPGEVIQLKGLIEPQSTFVVADAGAAADIASKANQKVNGLVFKGADAVVLKTGFNNSPCQCAVSTLASAINGIDKSNNQEPMSKDKQDFIKRIEQHYENTSVQTTVVDSIGRILINDDDNTETRDHPIIEDKTLRRVGQTCEGDRIEMDDFVLEDEWQSYAIDNFLDSGNFDKQDCLASRKDLLLSEYVEGTDKNAMIEIYNGTDRPIDFNSEQYILEIYNDDDKDPEQKIYLKGQVNKKGVFVIANDGAEKDLKDIANQTTGKLNLEGARAVVLKKVALPAYQACYADIANWIQNNDIQDITYTLTPIFDPGVGPDTDDDPRDGDDGGELASPN
jgi:hypothetical protein